MNENREAFLEKQINHFHNLIDDMESSKLNPQQKHELQEMKVLYKQYITEYKGILMSQD
jgi:hypothetical protein